LEKSGRDKGENLEKSGRDKGEVAGKFNYHFSQRLGIV
jgi:hypothetical protein